MKMIQLLPRKVGLGSIIFLVSLLVYYINLNHVWATDHTTSFLELDYSIWTNHSFALGKLGNFTPNSVDVFQYNGYYYSALAPGLALLALPFVIPGFIIDGHFSLYGNAMIFSEFFVAFMNAMAILFVYKLGRMYFKEAPSSFIAFAYAFSTISWPFATFFFQNDVSAAFDVIATYLVLSSTRGRGGFGIILLGGLAAGAASLTDYVNILLVPILLIYIITWSRTNRHLLVKSSLAFVLSTLAGVLAIAFYNYASFGQILVTSEQLYLNSPTPFGNFSTPLYLGIVLNLFTPLRGIFLYSPILLVGVPGFYYMLRKSSGMRKEALLILVVFLALFLPYCGWYGPEGGLSFGPRFIIASIPFLLLPAGYLVEHSGKYGFSIIYLLYSIGVLINGLAALTSALAGVGGWLTSPFLESTLPLLEGGILDQWWLSGAGQYWPIGAGLVILLVLLLPIVVGYLSERAEPSIGDPDRREIFPEGLTREVP